MKWWGWGCEHKQPDVSNMPQFLPYVRELLGCEAVQKKIPIKFEEIQLPNSITNTDFISMLSKQLGSDQIVNDKLSRLLHTYGKSYRDLWRIRQGKISRTPDVIIYPQSTQDVEAIIKAACLHNVCLIPFGGGTNIVGAIEAMENESRMVASIDMTRMNQVINVDSRSQTATVQAGALGPEIEKQLNAQNYSLGHFPDSFEFSSLGGWLATRSVGMQSDQNGTISDMTLSVHCVTPQGSMEIKPFPHAAIGPDLKQLILGSEGTFGIITEATMKVHPLPQCERYAAVLFPNFLLGLEAIRVCAVEKKLPHMMRLLDQEETQLSFHFKTKVSFLKKLMESSFKKYLGTFKKIDFNQCCLAILAFSGTPEEVLHNQRQVLNICQQYGSVYLGKTPGIQWFNRKYDYPYLRDLIMDFGCVVDVGETSVLWHDVEAVYENVKKAGYAAMEKCIPKKILQTLKKPGYLGCHLSHHYDNGTCMYFTFSFVPEEGQELAQYSFVKNALTDAMTSHGGSASHHHSIGYEHAKWLPEMLGVTSMNMLKHIKKSLDPTNVLNPRGLGQE